MNQVKKKKNNQSKFKTNSQFTLDLISRTYLKYNNNKRNLKKINIRVLKTQQGLSNCLNLSSNNNNNNKHSQISKINTISINLAANQNHNSIPTTILDNKMGKLKLDIKPLNNNSSSNNSKNLRLIKNLVPKINWKKINSITMDITLISNSHLNSYNNSSNRHSNNRNNNYYNSKANNNNNSNLTNISKVIKSLRILRYITRKVMEGSNRKVSSNSNSNNFFNNHSKCNHNCHNNNNSNNLTNKSSKIKTFKILRLIRQRIALAKINKMDTNSSNIKRKVIINP